MLDPGIRWPRCGYNEVGRYIGYIGLYRSRGLGQICVGSLYMWPMLDGGTGEGT